MLTPLCVFLVVLFVYIHVRYHHRPGQDRIIYELTDPSRELLHDTIHHKQPVKFNIQSADIGLEWGVMLPVNTTREVHMEEGGVVVAVPVNKITDVSGNHLIRSNQKFITEVDLTDKFASISHSLYPRMMTRVTYDLLGNHGVGDTPVHTIPTASSAHITYLVCTSGSAKVRLCSGKYTARICKDASVVPLESHLSFWDNSGNLANEELFAQIERLDTSLMANQAIAIPAHWWYSVELSPQTNLASFSYRSVMNELACLPETVRSLV